MASCAAHLGSSRGLEARFPPLRAHLPQQAPSGKVDVGQRQGRERTRGVLLQPAIAHLAKAPQPFDHPEYMLYASADAGLVAVLGPLQDAGIAMLAQAHSVVAEQALALLKDV